MAERVDVPRPGGDGPPAAEQHLPREYSRIEQVAFIQNFDVIKAMTENDAEGKMIWQLYQNSEPKALPNPIRSRKVITKLVIRAAMIVKPKLKVEDLEILSSRIEIALPPEKKEFYYTKIGNEYGGSLFHAFKNQNSAIEKLQKSVASKSNDETPDADPDAIESKNFLDSHCDPWEDVLAAWDKTRQMRHNDIYPVQNPKKKKKTSNEKEVPLERLLLKWKSLKLPSGYKLMESDFSAWFLNVGEMTEAKLDEIVHKLWGRRRSHSVIEGQKKIRWEEEINVLRKYINSNSTSQLVKTASKIKLLPFLLPTISRGNAQYKPTVIDTYQSLILHAKTAENVDNVLQERNEALRKKKKTLQPVIVVIGNEWENLQEVLCCINDVKWKVQDVITGLDIIFKSFFALNVEYPCESKIIWSVIQDYVYNMKKDIPSIAIGVLEDLETFPPVNAEFLEPVSQPRETLVTPPENDDDNEQLVAGGS